MITKRARELGVSFITGEPIVELRKIKGKLRQAISKDGNIYEGEQIIVAAGYETRNIIRTVGIDVPMEKLFEECIVTEAQPKMFDIMLGVATGDIYGHQTAHGSFVFGADTGLEPSVDRKDQMGNNAFGLSANCRGIIKYIPSLTDAKVVRCWSGWLDMCQDNVPVISHGWLRFLTVIPEYFLCRKSSGSW